MAVSDRKRLLQGIELFEGAKGAELTRLAQASEEVRFVAGDELIDQGDVGREAYFIVDGTVVVRRNNRRIATLGPGAPVGELSLLDRGPRTAHVTAESDVVALRLTAKEFDGVLRDCPDLTRRLLATLAGRVRELDRRIVG